MTRSFIETPLSGTGAVLVGFIWTASGTGFSPCSVGSSKCKCRSSNLRPPDLVTPTFQKSYEKWLLDDGKSITTVGVYLRPLRTIYNLAIANGIVDQKFCPFEKYKFKIPAGRNTKKALTLEEVSLFSNYKAIPESREEWARDLWMFSYFCNGMNIADIANLKWKDKDGDKILFIRLKTRRSSKQNLKPVVVILAAKEGKRIIERQCCLDRNPDGYVITILESCCTPNREKDLVHQSVKLINRYMRRIAAELGIDKPVTTYVARHSFSTVLKHAGASTEYISESLGHSSVNTTKSYLDSFEVGLKRAFAEIKVSCFWGRVQYRDF